MRARGGTTGRRPRVRSGTPGSSVTSRMAETPFSGVAGGGGAVITSTGGAAVAPAGRGGRGWRRGGGFRRDARRGCLRHRRDLRGAGGTTGEAGLGASAAVRAAGGGPAGTTAGTVGAGAGAAEAGRRRTAAVAAAAGVAAGAAGAARRQPLAGTAAAGADRRRSRLVQESGSLKPGGLEDHLPLLGGGAASRHELGLHPEGHDGVVRGRREPPGPQRGQQRV